MNVEDIDFLYLKFTFILDSKIEKALDEINHLDVKNRYD